MNATADHRDARRFRRGVDHRLCICGECQVGAIVDFDRALDKFVENGGDRVYRCECCLRLVPWCLGAADEFPDVCDDCYALLKRRDVTRWARWMKRVGEGPLPKYAATAAFSRLGLLRQAEDDGMFYPTGLGSRVIQIHADHLTQQGES